MVEPSLMLGLDLHGTLLEPGEIVRPELVEPVASALRSVRGSVLRFLCTGNDLEFVRRKVPGPILAEIDGHVLETGCSMSPDGEREQVLTSEEERADIRHLEARLRHTGFYEIDYFAHRLTTISMFCQDPRGFCKRVEEFVRQTPFCDRVYITYSSVAVDILPKGYNKHRGLEMVAAGKPTIGVADSMNDRALLEEADFALAPANMAPELRPLLEKKGRKIVPIEKAGGLLPDAVIMASQKETMGVIEILCFIERSLAA